MKKTIFIIVIFFFISCHKEEKTSNNPNKINEEYEFISQKKIDSLKNKGYEIYKQYDFFKLKGTPISQKSKIKYPFLGVRRVGYNMDIISLVSEDSIIKRQIVKKNNINSETIKNFRFEDESTQSVFYIVYNKNYISILVVDEFVFLEEEKRFFVEKILFIKRDYIVEYYQGESSERLITKDMIKNSGFLVDESDLEKYFTGKRNIEKKVFYPKDYNKITDFAIKTYFMLDISPDSPDRSDMSQKR